MTEAGWLAVCSALVTLIGVLGGLAYRDIARRLTKLEKQDAKLMAAMLTLLVAKPGDNVAIANAMHGLLTNGVETIQ